MFDIAMGENGTVVLSGRLDSAQVAKAQAFFDTVESPQVLDFSDLDYISSAGLGVLLVVQKRVMSRGNGLIIININKHINDIFRFSGFDKIFRIERGPD
jgi:anti-sigma B factor antagonist